MLQDQDWRDYDASDCSCDGFTLLSFFGWGVEAGANSIKSLHAAGIPTHTTSRLGNMKRALGISG